MTRSIQTMVMGGHAVLYGAVFKYMSALLALYQGQHDGSDPYHELLTKLVALEIPLQGAVIVPSARFTSAERKALRVNNVRSSAPDMRQVALDREFVIVLHAMVRIEGNKVSLVPPRDDRENSTDTKIRAQAKKMSDDVEQIFLLATEEA